MGYLSKAHPDLNHIDSRNGGDIDIIHLVPYSNTGDMIEGICAACKAITCVPVEEMQGRCERCGADMVCSSYRLHFG